MNEYSNYRKLFGIVYPILLYAIIQYIGSVIFTLAISGMAVINNRNITANDINGLVIKYSMVLFFITGLISIPVFFLIYRHDNKIINEFDGIKYEKCNWKYYIIIIPLGICGCTGFNKLISVLAVFLPASFINSFNNVNEHITAGSMVWTIIGVSIIAPIIEELIFRGLIFRRLKYLISTKWAIIISALIFGVYHGNLIQGIYAFILGIIMAFLYEKYQTIWASIIFHCVANTYSLIMSEYNERLFSNAGIIIITMVVEIIVVLYICKIINKRVNVSKVEIVDKEYEWN